MTFLNLPSSTFNTVVIDPPWPQPLTGKMDRPRHQRASSLPYRTMSVDDIASFPLAGLCNPGAHVYLWTTNRFLCDAFAVLRSWGVRYHLTMPLVKTSGIAPCRGYVFGAEYCLLGFMGRPMQPFLSMGRLNWLVTNPLRGTHSRKPDAFYSLAEVMSPGPRLDCFARRCRDGWSVWGDEV